MIQEKIKRELLEVLKKLDLPSVELQIEHPQEESHGDYATNVAMVLAKRVGKKPMELASLIVKELKNNLTIQPFSHITIAPPGFINFWLSKKWFGKQMKRVLKEKDEFGKLSILKGKKIMVEFAYPNTHKLFHIGHLRNIILGESIVRILEANNCKIIRANYQGDVGLHIAKALWAFAKRKTKNVGQRPIVLRTKKLKTLDQKVNFLGKVYADGSRAYEEDEKAKKEIIKINGQIYNQDPKIMSLLQETRQWSLDYFDRIYKRVYSKFDRFYFESEVAIPGKEIVLKALKKGIFEKSQGAVIFDGEKHGLHKRVFINKLSFPTYEAKDMGLGKLQFAEFSPDLIIHVVGPEQKGYFEVVFKALEQIFPKTKGKEFHLIYGWVRLKKGKMASRLGNVILGEWLIDEVKKRLLAEFKMSDKTAEIVAVAAVKYSFLKFSSQREIAFDIDESINMEGDSGPYLQYTYARSQSVLRKASQGDTSEVAPQSGDSSDGGGPIRYGVKIGERSFSSLKLNPEELAVLRMIYRFPEVVCEAGKNYAPNLICNFLFDLAQKFNGFYNKHRILDPTQDTSDNGDVREHLEDEARDELGEHLQGGAKHSENGSSSEVEKIRAFRFALTAATAQILKTGLDLLGIKMLERM